MERRRVNMDELSQRELPLNPPLERRRVSFEDVEVVTLRVDKRVAHAVEANPKGAVKALTEAAGDVVYDILMKTDWSRERPPCSGYWELKQRSAIAPDAHNWWYSAKLNSWHRGVPQKDSAAAQFVAQGVLMQGYEWRGLKNPHPDGYTYELEKAPFGSPMQLGGDVQKVEVLGKLDVTQQGVAPLDLNPVRRRVVP